METVVIVRGATPWISNNFRLKQLKLSKDTSNFQPHTLGRIKTTSVVPTCMGTVVIGKSGTLWATYNFKLEHLKLLQETSHSKPQSLGIIKEPLLLCLLAWELLSS